MATVVTFTSVGTTMWTVPAGVTSVEVLVVGGGAGGGGGAAAGGGGAGGLVHNGSYATTPGDDITVTVGGGGASGTPSLPSGNDGTSSVFGTITALGGGGGDYFGGDGGAVGGSGGGGASSNGGGHSSGQGNNGGNGYGASAGGGGGGAGAIGGASTTNVGGNGGAGSAYSTGGSATYYAGGGGGGQTTTPGAGGAGGGGAGGANANGTDGTVNTGGGGGGSGAAAGTGGSGGSGIVIVSYVVSVYVPFVRRQPTPAEEAPISPLAPRLVFANSPPPPSGWLPSIARTRPARDEETQAVRPRFIIPGAAGSTPWFPPRRRAWTGEIEQLAPSHSRRNLLSPLIFAAFAASARGLYRIFNPSVYRFYWSDSAPPVAGSTPQETSTTLAYTSSATFADGTWYLSVSYFDGVLDSGFLPVGPNGQTYLTLTIADGQATATPPSVPANFTLAQQSGGVVLVQASYLKTPDGTNAADAWAIYYTTDGSSPGSGPADSPTATKAMSAGPLQVLSFALPAQSAGTTIKVQLQVYRSGTPNVYCAASAVLTTVVSSAGPSAPLSLQSWAGALPEDA